MRIFFTADHHFGHTNIIKFEALNRVDEYGVIFSSVEQMDEFLIRRWNEVVGPDDLVYHLGDVSYKQETLRKIIPRLNGRKILICGNHDPYFKRMMSDDLGAQRLAQQRAREAGFEALCTEFELELEGIGIVKLSHYPYVPLHEEDELHTRYLNLRPEPTGEAMLIHGHVHSQWCLKKQLGRPLMVNAGVDVWRLRPLSVEDLQGIVAAYEE